MIFGLKSLDIILVRFMRDHVLRLNILVLVEAQLIQTIVGVFPLYYSIIQTNIFHSKEEVDLRRWHFKSWQTDQN